MIRKEVGKKRLMPENQAEFRKEKRVMDNVYILNFLVGRNLNRREGKMVVFFLDLKAAFDSMDRRILLVNERKKGERKAGKKM